jgi:hypothetical protein
MQVLVEGHGTMRGSTNPAGSVGLGVIDAAAALGVAMLLAADGVVDALTADGVVDVLPADVELRGAELGSGRPGAASGCDMQAAHAVRTTRPAVMRLPRRARCITRPDLE